MLEAARLGLPDSVLVWVALAPLTMLTGCWPSLRLSCMTLIGVVLVPASGAPSTQPSGRVVGILLGTAALTLVAAVLPAAGD